MLMKKKLSLLMVALVAVAAFAGLRRAAEPAVEITFQSTGTGSDSSNKISSIGDIVATGADFVEDITTATNVYNGREGRGVKLGTSKAIGELTLKLKEAVKPSKIVVNARKYNDKGENYICINDNEFELSENAGDDCTITYDGETEVSEIVIKTTETDKKYRAYVISIKVYVGGGGDEPTTRTATFENDGNWADVYAYAWSGEGDNVQKFLGDWPGTKLEATDDGYVVSITSDVAPEKIIFNNGDGIQTGDLAFEDGATYNPEGKVVPPTTFTVTFKNNGNWAEVYAYAWTDNYKYFGEWPGKKIEATDAGYVLSFEATAAPEKIIFNNGSGLQTADLDFVDGKTYNIINNIETLNAQENKAEFDFAGEALIVAKPTAKYVYIKDETGASLIYDASGEKTAAAEVGKTLAANWAGAVSIYNGLFEAVPAAALAVKDGEPVEVTYPEATAVDVKAENVNQVVTIKGLTVTPGTGKNITFKLGEQEIAGYNQFDLNLTEISAEKTYDVVGAISRFKETIQFQPITIKEVTPEPAQGLIPNGTYYVMNAGVGTLINAEGKVDAKGAPISFTYNGETYTIAGADFFAEKQWTIAEAVEGMSGYYYISTEVEGQKAYLSVAENALTPVTTPDENCVWIVLQQSYWEDIVNSTYTVAGTKNLTGTENDWDIVEANKMTYNEETKLFEMTYKKITVNNDTKPEFKVVKQPMEGAAVWYPEGDNWVITPDVVGGEGIFDITITFDPSDLKEIKVSALQYADIEISPAEGDIAAALAEASAGKIAENITINLAANGAYTISAPIVPSAGFVINGNGATIDASGLNDAFIKMDKNPNVEKVESGQYVVKTASKIDGVKITGLTKGLYADNGTAYAFENFTINNSVFQYKTQSTIVLNFASSMAINFNITNSTFFSLEAGSANFIALSGKRPWQITGYADVDGKLTVDHNTFYNVAKAKQFLNTNTLKGQNKYKYEMNSNIFVDVSNKKIYGNMTNNTVQVTTDGKNTYMWEGTFFAETNYNGDEGLQTDPGFKDAANGDFTIGASTAQAKEKTGDPRWIVPQLYIIGDMNGWDRTAMTAMTFNAEKQAFEYEYAPTTTAYFSFADKQLTADEAAADEDWAIFNATNRYAPAAGSSDATLNIAMNLQKGVDGSIVLKPVKEGTSYKISVAKDLSAVTITGEAAPEAPAKYYLVGSMTNWDVNADYELTPDNETEGQFKITKDFAANDAFKIVKGNKEAWYPDGMGNDYKITEAGNYTVYFNPAGGVEGWYEGFFNVVDNTSTGISAVKNAAALKDAQIYTISGQRVEKALKGLYIVNGKKVVIK